MNNTLKKTVNGIKEYLLMSVGMLLYAFGWIGCILPAQGVGGQPNIVKGD